MIELGDKTRMYGGREWLSDTCYIDIKITPTILYKLREWEALGGFSVVVRTVKHRSLREAVRTTKWLKMKDVMDMPFRKVCDLSRKGCLYLVTNSSTNNNHKHHEKADPDFNPPPRGT